MRSWREASGTEFRFRGGRLSLDFCSTLSWRRVEPLEQLRVPADLERWVFEAGIGSPPLRLRAGDVIGARRLREALYRLFRAHLEGTRPPRASIQVVNRFATAATARPRLALDGGRTWHAAEPAAAALSAIARDGIDLLAGPMAGRLRQCAARDCAFLFLDTSRARNRRWCASDRCGNREHVRAHRLRQGC